MANAAFVDIFNPSDQLLIDSNRCLLMQALLLHDVIKKFAIYAVFHYQIQLRLCLNDLVQLDHVRVSNLLEDFDLTRDACNVFTILDPSFLQDFDRYLFLRQNMLSHFNFSESSLAK